MEAQYSANLPQLCYTAQQVQGYEAQAAKKVGIDLWQLMQRAADSVFSLFEAELVDAEQILVLAGKGNNAGDAYLVARQLHLSGRVVSVLPLYDPSLLSGDALRAYTLAKQAKVTFIDALPEQLNYSAIVDGVFGTGFKGLLPAAICTVFNRCNQACSVRVSIDVPSGVNATTSEVAQDSFCADHTVTFIALKQGLLTGRALAHCGRVLFADLGVAQAFAALVSASTRYPDPQTLLALRPKRLLDSYKNSCGHVLLIGGNLGMAGAVRLAAEACLRMGAGLVSVATHLDNVASVLQGRYELMVHGVANSEQLQPLVQKADVVVIGPGLGQDNWSRELLDSVLHSRKAMVLDADALNLLAHSARKLHNSIITPHLGEARRLLPEADGYQDRFKLAKQLHDKYGAVVVLKGPGSLILAENSTSINRSGTPAMASAGMGDILSGMIAALIAQGVEQFAAAQLAVYIHGLAAQLAAKEGEKGLLASDLFVYIRRLLG